MARDADQGDADGALELSPDAELMRAEEDVARARQRVAHSMTELQDELIRKVDWRRWVRRKPGLAVGIAFGLGLLLGRRR